MTTRIHIYKNGDVRGNGETPPEVEIWMDAFERAIRDIRWVGNELRFREARADAYRWVKTNHFFWIASMIYGVESATVMRNWMLDGAPLPEEARKRKAIYQTVRQI